jgi:hypothetical protein
MKDTIICVVGLFLCAALVVFGDFGPEGRVYDCNMAEWHPDIPLEIKEECRKMRKEFYEHEKQKTRLST